jgi:hypothetical protein
MFIKECKGMKMCENRYLSQAKEEKQEFEDQPEYRNLSEGKYRAVHHVVCLSNLFLLPGNNYKYCYFGTWIDFSIHL